MKEKRQRPLFPVELIYSKKEKQHNQK